MAAFAAGLASAIPVIEKVITAIWPKGDNQKKKPEDAQAKVKELKTLSGDALKVIADQLKLVSTMMEACFVAEDNVVRMQAVLDAAKENADLSKSDKFTITKWWGAAKKNIKSVSGKDTLASVKAIEDAFIKRTFLDVLEADIDGIDADLKEWELKTLSKDLQVLFLTLDKVNKVAVEVADGIANGLQRLSVDQKKPAAKPTKPAAGNPPGDE